jgi:nickel-dependent lactate racemase
MESQLGYGRIKVQFEFEPSQYAILESDTKEQKALSDADVGNAIENPISSRPLDEIVQSGESALIVVSDATRATASSQIVNLIVRRLIETGITPSNISIIFSTGIHRPVSLQEKQGLLSPFIAQRIRTLDHNPESSTDLVQLGTTDLGTPIEVNRALVEFNHVILTGGIGFHYFAGFSGGRKSICPGLASTQTIKATHLLALDLEAGGRRKGVGTGLLDGNAVHLECERVAEMIKPSFLVNAIVDDRGRAVAVYAGDWRDAHRKGCDDYLAAHSKGISAKRDVVIASCGGWPYDINLIQAHKSLEMASQACADSGTIILLAECTEGLGRADFLSWFDETDSRALEARLHREYQVNGQTAWSLLTKAERFRIVLVSSLPEDQVRKMRMIPARTLDEALLISGSERAGFLMPRAAVVRSLVA